MPNGFYKYAVVTKIDKTTGVWGIHGDTVKGAIDNFIIVTKGGNRGDMLFNNTLKHVEIFGEIDL